jgi:hypothetical protein
MWKKSSQLLFLVLITGSGTAGASDLAVKGTINSPKASNPKVVLAPLSADECREMKGQVLGAGSAICESGQYCARKDQNGQWHRVCISAEKMK